MDVNTIFTLVSVGLFVLCVLIGALWGMKRGLQKTGLRFIYFLFAIVIVAFFTGMITNAIMEIDISKLVSSSTPVSIKGYIQQAFLSTEEISKLVEEVPSVLQLAENLPIALASSVIFIVLVYIVKAITWIIYAITVKFIVHDMVLVEVVPDAPNLQMAEAQASHGKTKYVKKDKNRWGGALVGALFGFTLLVLTFFPLNAIARTYTQLTTAPIEEVVAESEVVGEGEPESGNSSDDDIVKDENGKYKKSYNIVADIIPADIKPYIEMYTNSFFTKATGLFGMDNFIFDQVSKIKVGDERIMIRKELVTAVQTYDEAVEYLNIDFSDPSKIDFKTFNFDSMDKIVDNIFGSGFIRSIANELIPYLMDSLKEVESLKENENYDIIVRFIDAFEFSAENQEETTAKVCDILKSDMKSLIKVAKAVCESGLVDELKSGTYDMEKITAIIQTNDYELIGKVYDGIFSSTTIKNVSSVGFDIMFEKLAEVVGIEGEIGNITKDIINFEELGKDFTKLTKGALVVFNSIGTDIEEFADAPYMIFDKDSTFRFNDFVGGLGDVLDVIKSNALYSNETENQFDKIMAKLAEKEEYAKYFDFTILKDHNLSIKTELLKIADSLMAVREGQIVQPLIDGTLTTDDEEFIETLLAKLATKDANDVKYLSRVLSPLFDNKLLQKPLTYGFDLISDEIYNLLEIENPNLEVSDDLVAQKVTLLNAFENIADAYPVIKEIATAEGDFDINNLTEEQMAVIEQTLSALQANAYFDKTAETPKGGVFKPVYLALKDYILQGKDVNVNFETIEWDGFISGVVNVAKQMSEVFEGEVTTDKLVEVIAENKENVKVVVSSLGLDETLVDDIVEVSTEIGTIVSGEASKTEVATALGTIGTTLENIDEDTLNDVTTLVNEFTGEDVSAYISVDVIAKEADSAKAIADALANGVTEENIPTILTTLTSGNGYVLDAVASTDYTIDTTMNETDFTTALTTAGVTDATEIAKYKALFGYNG